MPAGVRFCDRQKFLWDGEEYDSPSAAETKKSEYEAKGFETRLFQEEGKGLLYTRRVVKDVVVQGEAPP